MTTESSTQEDKDEDEKGLALKEEIAFKVEKTCSDLCHWCPQQWLWCQVSIHASLSVKALLQLFTRQCYPFSLLKAGFQHSSLLKSPLTPRKVLGKCALLKHFHHTKLFPNTVWKNVVLFIVTYCIMHFIDLLTGQCLSLVVRWSLIHR